MADNTAAVQILITINGQSVTVKNNKKNVVSLKVSRVIGDAANKFTLELFDETAWKLESALYGTKNTPISIQYGATGNWNSKNVITFTGICTNYNLSFVGAATMLAIEGVVHTTGSVDGSTNATFWFRNETVCWVDCEVDLPDNFDVNKANSRAACKIDGKSRLGAGGLDRGFEDVVNNEYADYICARIEWIPPEDNDGKNWAYRPLVNPTNIFKRIIRKYNGDEDTGANYKQMSQDFGGEGVEEQERWYKEVQESYGNFKIGEYDETLWVDATSFQPGMLQSNTTAADFITNVLCKIAVKPGSGTAGFKYYVNSRGEHCFKAIDYNSSGESKIVKTGYYVKDSDVISFSLNQVGALVMAGCDKEAGQTYVDTSALDLLTNDLITSEGYFAEGHYKSEKAMEDSNELTGTGTTNWWFKQVAGIKVNSSSTQSLLNATYGEAFDKISELTLSATLTIWGEYNNKYVPGNYLDLVVMTPDGHKHYGSGKYFIISSDDSITSDGYTTTLKLLKNTDISKNTFADNFTAEKVKPGTYAHDINPYTETGTQYSGKNGTPTTEEILASYKTRVDKIVGEDFQLTAYCGCSVCCGSNADGYTATGTKATQGRTIAVDPNVIPLHSEVTIKLKTSDGKYQTLGNYIAEDTGSAIKEHIIDVYFDNHQEALNFGRKYNAIVIVTSYK